jgi:hypothetical protein
MRCDAQKSSAGTCHGGLPQAMLADMTYDSLFQTSELCQPPQMNAANQYPLGPNTLMPSFFSIARPKRYFISGPS